MRTKPQSNEPRIFADGSKPSRPLALHPEAIGVAYPPRKTYDRETYQLREMVASDVAEIVDGIAVLSVEGPLEHKGGGGWWCFWQTYEELARDFKLVVDDESVSAVVLKFDSPGGEVSGLTETVRILQQMKEASGKRVIAYVDEDCYSAAYALAMVADEIYLPESGGVGSIGVITAMVDVTKMDQKDGIRVEVIASGAKKADGHPHVPLSSGAIKRAQKRVDKLAAAFFDLVSEGRGLSVEEIAAMQAGVFTGTEAVSAGLADGVMTLGECLTLAADVFGSTEKPTDHSAGAKETTNMGVLAATRALNEANAKLAAAKTDKERASAAALVTSAEQALAAAKASEKPAAKVKKTKTVVTDTHEEEIDDGEPEDDEDEDEEDDDDASSDDADDSAEDDDAEESASTSATNAASAVRSVKSDKALARFVLKMTGQKTIEQAAGALQAAWDSNRRTAKLAAKVARLEQDATRTKLGALVAKGMKAGQLAPSQKRWAMTQTPESLKAYLETAPKMVHTSEDEHTEAQVTGHELGAVTAEMAKIWRKQGFAEKDFPALLAKFNQKNGATRANGAS